jgi:hypothetical protein
MGSKTVAQVVGEEAKHLKAITSGRGAEAAVTALHELATDHAEVGVPGLDRKDPTLRARRAHLREVKAEIERLVAKLGRGAAVRGRIAEMENERDVLIRSIRAREDEHLARLDDVRG